MRNRRPKAKGLPRPSAAPTLSKVNYLALMPYADCRRYWEFKVPSVMSWTTAQPDCGYESRMGVQQGGPRSLRQDAWPNGSSLVRRVIGSANFSARTFVESLIRFGRRRHYSLIASSATRCRSADNVGNITTNWLRFEPDSICIESRRTVDGRAS